MKNIIILNSAAISDVKDNRLPSFAFQIPSVLNVILTLKDQPKQSMTVSQIELKTR